MSDSDRGPGFSSARLIFLGCIIAAMVVGALLFQVKQSYNEKRNYKGTSEQDTGYNHCLKIPFVIDTCTEKHNAAIQKSRDDNDLRAQQEMADWAFYTVTVGAIGIILSFGGLLFVYGTLQQTSKSISISNRQLVADNRPWIQIAPQVAEKIHFQEDGSCRISGALKFKNTGHGPALKIRMFQDEFPFDVENISAETKVRIDKFSNSYNSGEQRGQTLFPGQTDVHLFNLIVSAKVVEKSLSQYPDGEMFFLTCSFIFAAIYESAIGGDVQFHTSVVQVVNEDIGNGMMSSIAVNKAQPRSLAIGGKIYLQEYPATYQAT